MKKPIYLLIIVILLLCACTAKAPVTMLNDGNSEVTPDELGVGDDVENDLDNSTFISDYLPGEENLVGNLWTNRMFCRQGDYIYHFNEAEGCLEKWRSDEGIENAETICRVNTKMLPAAWSSTYNSAYDNHLEVVGDYIYICLMTGEKIGDANLTTIACYSTNGDLQATVVTDCANCQYRIINNTLFYLTVVHYQEDLSTETYCIAIKSLDLEHLDLSNPDIDPQDLTLQIRNSITPFPMHSYDGGFNPENLFVMQLEDEGRYIIGYQYVCTQGSYRDYSFSVCNVVEKNQNSNEFLAIDGENDTNVGSIHCAENSGNIMITDDTGTYLRKINSWPNDVQEVRVLSEKQYIRCVTEEFIFYIDDYINETLFALNRSTGEQWKVNNDSPSAVEFVDDGKIYYYMYKDKKYTLCRCNLDGSEWTQIYSYS